MEYHLISNHSTYDVWSDNGVVCEFIEWFGNILTAMNYIEDQKRGYSSGAISSNRFANMDSREMAY